MTEQPQDLARLLQALANAELLARATSWQTELDASAHEELTTLRRLGDAISLAAAGGTRPTAMEVAQLREQVERIEPLLRRSTDGTLAKLADGLRSVAEAAASLRSVRPLVPRQSRVRDLEIRIPEQCPGCGKKLASRFEGDTLIVEFV